jgi:16S rRNA (cytidine1402-2'-O)-methyltransferase
MGTLYVVGTPIGNLGDITFRAIEILNNVDYIACEDTRQSLKLLNHYEIKKRLVAYHKFNESNKSNVIINDLINGKNVAVITDAGTPCISDPGYVLIKKCHENNIKVIAIPGASAVVSSLSVSGIDTSKFAFVGFLPTDNSKMKEELQQIKESSINTFVIYESPKRILKLFSKLMEFFPHSLVYVASDLTKIHERGFYGEIEDVYNILKDDENIEKGEYAIIINKHLEERKEVEKERTIEGLLIDIMINNKCSLKEAINILNNSSNLKKNEIYNASLNLKKIMDN